MLLARAATKEEKENNYGGVAAGRPKKKKQRVMTNGVLDRAIYYYLGDIADANGMPQPQPPRGPPPSHILKDRRFAIGAQFVVSS